MPHRFNPNSNRLIVLLSLTALVVAMLPAPASAAVSSSKSPMNVFDTTQKIPGGYSILYRNDTGVAMRIHTRDLPVGTYTVWWIIWNDPGVCASVPCGLVDLFKPGNDLGFATGGIVSSENGKFTPAAGLSAGDLTNMLLGVGLTNPHGAEIHLVVQWHGPIVPEVVHLQMQSPPGGTCHPDTGCPDLQSSIHLP